MGFGPQSGTKSGTKWDKVGLKWDSAAWAVARARARGRGRPRPRCPAAVMACRGPLALSFFMARSSHGAAPAVHRTMFRGLDPRFSLHDPTWSSNGRPHLTPASLLPGGEERVKNGGRRLRPLFSLPDRRSGARDCASRRMARRVACPRARGARSSGASARRLRDKKKLERDRVRWVSFRPRRGRLARMRLRGGWRCGRWRRAARSGRGRRAAPRVRPARPPPPA